MLPFEGDRNLPHAPTGVWTRLSDARFLAQCIPDIEAVTQCEKDLLVCKLRPGFAFVRGTLDLTLNVVDAVEGQSERLRLKTKGIGTSSTVEVALDLAPQNGGTRVHWSAAIQELGGLLKAIPQGLIRAAAEKVIADAWAAVEAKLPA